MSARTTKRPALHAVAARSAVRRKETLGASSQLSASGDPVGDLKARLLSPDRYNRSGNPQAHLLLPSAELSTQCNGPLPAHAPVKLCCADWRFSPRTTWRALPCLTLGFLRHVVPGLVTDGCTDQHLWMLVTEIAGHHIVGGVGTICRYPAATVNSISRIPTNNAAELTMSPDFV
jgi:hypothetical protein